MANGLLGMIAAPQLADIGGSFRAGRQNALATAMNMQAMRQQQQAMQQQAQMAPLQRQQAQLGIEQGQLGLQQAQQAQRSNLIKESVIDAVAAFSMPFDKRVDFLKRVAPKYEANPIIQEGFEKTAKMGEKEQTVDLLKTIQAGAASGILPQAPKPEKDERLTRLLVDAGFKKGTPKFREKLLELIEKEGRGQTISIDTGEKAESSFAKQLGKKQAETFSAQEESMIGVVESLRQVDEARKLLDEGVITGFGANFLLGMGKALKQIGINNFDDAIANTEAFAASQAKQVAQIIKAFGAGTGLSDADREYALKAAAGDKTMDESAIRKILDINEKAYKNSIAHFNKRFDKLPDDLKALSSRIELPGPVQQQPVQQQPVQQQPVQQQPVQQQPVQQQPVQQQPVQQQPVQQQPGQQQPVQQPEQQPVTNVVFAQHPTFGDITDEKLQQVANDTGESVDDIKNRLNNQVVIPNHPTFGNITEESIQKTMKKHGVSRQEVIDRMLQQMQQSGFNQQQMLQSIGVQ